MRSAPAASDERRPSAVGSETLLVVDDEDLVRKAVSAMLETAGYRVLKASSGAEALALFEGDDPLRDLSLILLDLSMPGMPGRLVRTKLREKAPDVPVVFFTGYAAEPVEDELDAVLEKPVSANDLLAKVREMLDRRPDPGACGPRSK
jgi:CheY-like chemotaxis protein